MKLMERSLSRVNLSLTIKLDIMNPSSLFRDQEDHRVREALREKEDLMVHRVPPDLKVREDSRDQEVQLVRSDHKDFLEVKATEEPEVTEERRETEVCLILTAVDV